MLPIIFSLVFECIVTHPKSIPLVGLIVRLNKHMYQTLTDPYNDTLWRIIASGLGIDIERDTEMQHQLSVYEVMRTTLLYWYWLEDVAPDRMYRDWIASVGVSSPEDLLSHLAALPRLKQNYFQGWEVFKPWKDKHFPVRREVWVCFFLG